MQNRRPIISTRGVNASPPQDQYFKGALFLNTLRSVVDDDKRWWAMLRGFHDRFKHKNIMTEDVVEYFNRGDRQEPDGDLRRYLRHTAIPVLELKFDEAKGVVSYRWKADEKAFAMPVRVGTKDNWQVIQPTTELARHEDAAQEGPVRGGDGPLLCWGEQDVVVSGGWGRR